MEDNGLAVIGVFLKVHHTLSFMSLNNDQNHMFWVTFDLRSAVCLCERMVTAVQLICE